MEDAIDILKRLLDKHGINIIHECPGKLACSIRNELPNSKREANLLLFSLEHDIPHQMLLNSKNLYKKLLSLSQQLYDDYGIDIDLGQWVVETWATCLNLTDRKLKQPNKEKLPTKTETKNRLERHLSLTLFIEKHQDNFENFQLHCLRNLRDEIPDPLWYQKESKQITDYILTGKQKPIILTGYERFGGSFLVNWAISKAEIVLQKKTELFSSSSEKVIVLRVCPDGDTGLISNTDFEVKKLLSRIKYSKHYPALRKKLSKYLFDDATYPYFQTDEIIQKETKQGGSFKAPILKAKTPILHLESGEGSSGETKKEVEKKFLPVQPLEKITGILQIISYSLPTEDSKSLVYKLLVRNEPHRVLVSFDKVNNINHLKEIQNILKIEGNFRVIVIVDKYHFDKWCQTQDEKNWIQDNFEVIKCMPIWEDDLAEKICNFYFQIPDKNSRNSILTDFLAGLNYSACGSPGEVLHILRNYWGNEINQAPDTKNSELFVNDKIELMIHYRTWARIARLVNGKWSKISNSKDLVLPTKHFALGEVQSRARLLVQKCLNFIIQKSYDGFDINEFTLYAKKISEPLLPDIPEGYIFDVCNRLIGVLKDAELIKEGIKDPITGYTQSSIHEDDVW